MGSEPGDRDPVAARRDEDHLGWAAGGSEDRTEPAALRPRSPRRRRSAGRGRPADLARGDADRRRGRPRGDDRPRWQRVPRADTPLDAAPAGGGQTLSGTALEVPPFSPATARRLTLDGASASAPSRARTPVEVV